MRSELIAGFLSAIIAGMIFFTAPLLSQLWLTPHLLATATDDEVNTTTVIIRNDGLAEAVDGKAWIFTSIPLKINTFVCPEGNMSNLGTTKIQIGFVQISKGIDCNIQFVGHERQNINYIFVNAKNSPGYTLDVKNEIYQQLSRLELVNVMIFLVDIIGICAVTALIFNLIKRRARRKIRNSTLRESEQELTAEIRKSQENLQNERSRLDSTTDKEIFRHSQKTIHELEDEIREKNDELDKLRITLSTDESYDSLVGEFFNKWILIERELIELGRKHGVDFTYLPMASMTIVKKLLEKNIVTKEFVTLFNDVRPFRNRLAHGREIPSKELLKKNNENLDKLSKLLSEVKEKK